MLREIARDRFRGKALGVEKARHVGRIVPRVAENERHLRILVREDLQQVCGAISSRDAIINVVNFANADEVFRKIEADGILEIVVAEPFDLGGDGRRKEHGLASLRQGVEDGIDLLKKAHREHLIGFVEDQKT